jgi:hypothetical protein
MKLKLATIAIAIVLAGCASTKNEGEGAVKTQKLSTSFAAEKIKIETNCTWHMFKPNECELVAIESTATATSFGNTANNRKTALTVAEMRANSQVAEFISKDISTTRVTHTISKNLEKANDKVKSGNSDGSTVEMSDKEAATVSLRENNNETVHTLTETIRTNSQAILKGFIKINQEVVGNQEVLVTVRWDKDTERTAETLRRKFSTTPAN